MKHSETGEKIRALMEYAAQAAPESIGNQFHFELIDKDEQNRVYTFRCKTEKWMANAFGTLHGGIGSLILDQAMGYAAHALSVRGGFTPTIQMQQAYHKFFTPGETARIVVKAKSVSGTLIHMQGDMFAEAAPSVLCVSATAVYYNLKAK